MDKGIPGPGDEPGLAECLHSSEDWWMTIAACGRGHRGPNCVFILLWFKITLSPLPVSLQFWAYLIFSMSEVEDPMRNEHILVGSTCIKVQKWPLLHGSYWCE